MDRQTHIKTRIQFEQAVRMYMHQFCLDNYYTRFIYKNSDKKDATGETMLSSSVVFPYLTVKIYCYPTFFRSPPDEQHLSILHEVMHVILWGMDYYRKKSEDVFGDKLEATCDALAWGIYNKR